MKARLLFSLFILCGLFTGCGNRGSLETADVDAYFNLTTEEIPEVQMLVPGFTVKELPVSLNNINVLRYGPDGRLYALAYDGHIHVLTDTSGDGVEDKAELWWDEDPLHIPVGMVVDEEGVYTTSYNKVSLLKDTNGDGKGDTEEVITGDWKAPEVYTGTTETGVDAFGIAKDEEGNIFFALGSADFTNAFQIDSLGDSNYDLGSERGTVLKVAPGSNQREIYCTGTRFPVAMAFNEEGDLFASDQEGATWLANGNPYDELLHIEEGKHYGFPPRHPKHLPGVIDEPSVYDYKPQHQSTCGLTFNLPVNGGQVFGPAWWQGDAFVSGFSRGKIYRTKVTKTPVGYVARNDIIASLKAMVVDACVSPDGDLVMATHAGFPDWGYGPQAKGRLFKAVYTDTDAPTPVSVWASGPDQLKVAFDKPLKKQYLEDLADKIVIEFGEYVEAADRYEVLRPGYKAVERQMQFPREKLQVKDVALSDDRTTLVINTFTHTVPVKYAVTLPTYLSGGDNNEDDSLRQIPAMDLSYDLSGVEVTWQENSGDTAWSGWVPHLDLKVSKDLLGPVTEKEELENVLTRPGKITWKTQLNLWNMLRPDVQPESILDYKLPPEEVDLVFRSNEPLEIRADSADIAEPVQKGELYETRLTFPEVGRQPYELEVSMETSREEPVLEVHYSTAEDSRPRALQVHRFFAPWLDEIFPPEVSTDKEIPQLAGGNWARGKKLFFGESTCATCHTVNGQGKTIGPDLSNLIYRDYQSVLKDIQDPGAAINPDYVAHEVTLEDGGRLVGMVSSRGDSVFVRDAADKRTALARSEVQSIDPLSASLMPPGLDKMLGEEKMKDLMTYLLTAFEPAEIQFPFLPPMRNASEVNTVLKNSNPAGNAAGEDSLKIVWVSGPKDHGPDEHDYPLQQERWTQLLASADKVEITPVEGWPEEEHFKEADVIVFYWNYQEFTEENGADLDAFLERGGGLVYLHYAVDATANPKALADRIGMAWEGGVSKFRHGQVLLDFKDKEHPITRGFDKITFHDESYWNLVKGDKEMNVLATGHEEGEDIPLLWTTEGPGDGRVFVSILGHYNWTFDDPLFRVLLLRSIAWAGHQPEERLEELATLGARVSK